MVEGNHLDPSILIIFGAGGNLTRRKLIPALFNLYVDHWLPERFAILCIDLKTMGSAEFRNLLYQGVSQFSRRGEPSEQEWHKFAALINYISADFTDTSIYNVLEERLSEIDSGWGIHANHVFYQATSPKMVETIVKHLGQSRLIADRTRTRIVFEKPFGSDLKSARALNGMLTQVLDESQIYRIDHYLGKETVQNILAFRFANALFEPIWDRRYIDHIQISIAEDVGIEHRGKYYDQAGALRDMVQNHLLQVLCLVAMEPPVSFEDQEIRNKKVDVLHAIRPIPLEHLDLYAVRGQYASNMMRGEQVAGYRQEQDVRSESTTETFAALKLFVDNWRWQDVPFYLRTGKRLPERISEVSIQFQPVPHRSFPSTVGGDWQPNRLVIRIQPKEGIQLCFQAKKPGPQIHLGPVEMRFTYQDAFRASPPEAYETLLLDVIMGDATLFMRADQVESAWSVVDPILTRWAAEKPGDFPNYLAGTWGPDAAQELISRDGRSWAMPCDFDEET